MNKCRMNPCLIVCVVVAIMGYNVSSHAEATLQEQYIVAQQHYDPIRAKKVHFNLIATENLDTPLYAKTCLLLATLYRLEYEELATGDNKKRREFGVRIDAIAQEGILALESWEESSEKYRVRADLLGTMIRTKFQARKYRRKMEEAISIARTLDPKNPRALISAAKPLLFGKNSDDNVNTALELINQSLELDSTSEQAWLMRGMAYDRLGNLEQADQDWAKALDINPHSSLALKALGR